MMRLMIVLLLAGETASAAPFDALWCQAEQGPLWWIRNDQAGTSLTDASTPTPVLLSSAGTLTEHPNGAFSIRWDDPSLTEPWPEGATECFLASRSFRVLLTPEGEGFVGQSWHEPRVRMNPYRTDCAIPPVTAPVEFKIRCGTRSQMPPPQPTIISVGSHGRED